MSINLDKSKINIVDLLKVLSSNINISNLINFYGDTAIKRKANEIQIFDLDDGLNNLIILDDGEIPSDFIIEKGVEFNELKKYCPYIFNTSSISNKFSISYFSKNDTNKSIELDLSNKHQDQIIPNITKIKDEFLIQKAKSTECFFAISFKVEKTESYKNIQKKIYRNYAFRYHKLLNKNQLKIISLPERKYYKGFDPLFENFDQTRKGKSIQFRGTYKLDMRYYIIPKSIKKEVINTSSPNGTLDSSCGLFFYNKNGILINKPNFYRLERELNVSQSIKEKNIRYVKLEIKSVENDISSNDDIEDLINDKFVRKQIITILEDASKLVPQEIQIIEKDIIEEKIKIFSKRIHKFFQNNNNKEECIKELYELFPYESDRNLIKELVNDR